MTGHIIDGILRCLSPSAPKSTVIHLWMPYSSGNTETNCIFQLLFSAHKSIVIVIEHMASDHITDIIGEHPDML